MNLEYSVLHLMAHDYLAIPATTCIAECSFSLSAHTDAPQQRQMQTCASGPLLCMACPSSSGVRILLLK